MQGGAKLSDDPLIDALASSVGKVAGVSQMSIDTYRARLHRLTDATGKPLDKSLIHAAASYKVLQKKYSSPTTRKSIVTAVMSVFSHSPDFAKKHNKAWDTWKTRHRNLVQIETSIRDDNRATDDMKDTLPIIADVRVKAAELKKKTGLSKSQDSMDHLLLTMMVDMPPKRADFGDLQVLFTEPKNTGGNYVVVPKKVSEPVTLVMNEYKTAKRKGTFREEIPKSVAADLRKSLKDFPRKYVFVGRDNDNMTANAYSEYVKRAFFKHTGKASGVNALRHAYITQECNPGKRTIAELKQIAESMNHSVVMQATYHVVGGGIFGGVSCKDDATELV